MRMRLRPRFRSPFGRRRNSTPEVSTWPPRRLDDPSSGGGKGADDGATSANDSAMDVSQSGSSDGDGTGRRPTSPQATTTAGREWSSWLATAQEGVGRLTLPDADVLFSSQGGASELRMKVAAQLLQLKNHLDDSTAGLRYMQADVQELAERAGACV